MTRDDIIRLAREAGLCSWIVVPENEATKLEWFAFLVAAAERAACLEIISKIERRKWEILRDGGEMTGAGLHDAFMEIRARGEK